MKKILDARMKFKEEQTQWAKRRLSDTIRKINLSLYKTYTL